MNPTVGPSSILGWLGAAGGLITSTVQSLQSGEALASGPGKWPAILGVIALVFTNAGRHFQAAHLNKAATVAEDVGGALTALAAEAQANVAQVGTDGTDGAHVAFSEAEQPPAA